MPARRSFAPARAGLSLDRVEVGVGPFQGPGFLSADAGEHRQGVGMDRSPLAGSRKCLALIVRERFGPRPWCRARRRRRRALPDAAARVEDGDGVGERQELAHVRQFVAVRDGRSASRARSDPRSCEAWVRPVAGIRRGAALLGRDDGPHRRAVLGGRRRPSIGRRTLRILEGQSDPGGLGLAPSPPATSGTPEPDLRRAASAAGSAHPADRAGGRSPSRQSWGRVPDRGTAGCRGRWSWSGRGCYAPGRRG